MPFFLYMARVNGRPSGNRSARDYSGLLLQARFVLRTRETTMFQTTRLLLDCARLLPNGQKVESCASTAHAASPPPPGTDPC